MFALTQWPQKYSVCKKTTLLEWLFTFVCSVYYCVSEKQVNSEIKWDERCTLFQLNLGDDCDDWFREHYCDFLWNISKHCLILFAGRSKYFYLSYLVIIHSFIVQLLCCCTGFFLSFREHRWFSCTLNRLNSRWSDYVQFQLSSPSSAITMAIFKMWLESDGRHSK